ncbi:hypothetical protein AURDEDRAFT_165495 [Auricularia subglabra TFB-10046 SS5]|nr:hypothetical protein AURDEDRAFT_165495 [Auricularia subglabra TFB-10046 SS5]
MTPLTMLILAKLLQGLEVVSAAQLVPDTGSDVLLQSSTRAHVAGQSTTSVNVHFVSITTLRVTGDPVTVSDAPKYSARSFPALLALGGARVPGSDPRAAPPLQMLDFVVERRKFVLNAPVSLRCKVDASSALIRAIDPRGLDSTVVLSGTLLGVFNGHFTVELRAVQFGDVVTPRPYRLISDAIDRLLRVVCLG